MSDTRKIESLSVDDIVIPEGRRELQDDRVEDLAVSMQLIGLRHPIAVRFKDDKPHLVDGLHRLRAAQILVWHKIDCEITEVSDRRARLHEIAANLHRAELTVLDRSEAITEWVRLAKEEFQEISAQLAQKIGPGRPQGGQSAAGRAIGVDRDAVGRAQKIAGLAPAAKAIARERGLANNQAALLRASRSPDPVKALQENFKQRRGVSGDATQNSNRQPLDQSAQMVERACEPADLSVDELDRFADKLVHALGEEIPELVRYLETEAAAGLAKALRQRCPDLFQADEQSRARSPAAMSERLADREPAGSHTAAAITSK